MHGKLFVISGPSGVGKTTLSKHVVTALKDRYTIEEDVSYTTRSPRPREKNGRDYHFISREDFLKKEREGFFLETIRYDGNCYGSSNIIEKLNQGTSVVMTADRNGAKEVKAKLPGTTFIWITVSDIDALRKRMRARASQSEEQIDQRLRLAQKEMAREEQEKFFSYHVKNDILSEAKEKITAIVERELSQ